MYHVAICDDEVVFIDKISELLQKYAKKKKLNLYINSSIVHIEEIIMLLDMDTYIKQIKK